MTITNPVFLWRRQVVVIALVAAVLAMSKHASADCGTLVLKSVAATASKTKCGFQDLCLFHTSLCTPDPKPERYLEQTIVDNRYYHEDYHYYDSGCGNDVAITTDQGDVTTVWQYNPVDNILPNPMYSGTASEYEYKDFECDTSQDGTVNLTATLATNDIWSDDPTNIYGQMTVHGPLDPNGTYNGPDPSAPPQKPVLTRFFQPVGTM